MTYYVYSQNGSWVWEGDSLETAIEKADEFGCRAMVLTESAEDAIYVAED